MKILFKDTDGITMKSDFVILPVFKKANAPAFQKYDRILNGLLSEVLGRKPSVSEKGAEVVHVHGKPWKGIMLAGLGDPGKAVLESLRRCGGNSLNALKDYAVKNILFSVSDLTLHNLDYLPFVEGFLLNRYQFASYRSNPEKKPGETLTVLKAETEQDSKESRRVLTIAESVHFVRDLVNTPSNDLTPSALADAAKGLAGKRLKVTAFGRKDIKKIGMNAFYSVARGSHEEPKLIIMEYRGAVKSPLVALVGKSITFDSGGLSLKPSEGMEKMKYDMAGGAAVIGVMKAVSRLNLPVNVAGILPACENMPGGSATRPGDIVMTLSGKSVEIVNTDAEGRLVLADAIEYTKKLNPRVIIDVATLTGACSVAFGNEAVAMMGNDQKSMDIMKRAAEGTGERVWQMPLYDELAEYIKSDAADMKNTGGRTGSLIASGYFLKEFAGDLPWVHLDIASMAWNEKDRPYSPKGASGVGVRLLMEFLREV